MNEKDYLGDPSVGRFTAFVRNLITDARPRIQLRAGVDGNRRTVASLPEVLDVYSWRGESFAEVSGKVEAMRREMRSALALCESAEDGTARRMAELELLFVATKTLSWGRVYEGAFGFLIHQAETGVLSKNLRRAAELMDGDVEDVGAFDDNPYRSDCGMTKVYAAITARSVVYDARLGAALALLCRRHLELAGQRVVPELLTFMAGDRDDPRSNPSGGGFLFAAKKPGSAHARWNLRATWIISRLARDEGVAAVLGGTPTSRIRRIEAALFMIGDDVQDQPRCGKARPAKSVGPRQAPPLSAATESGSSQTSS